MPKIGKRIMKSSLAVFLCFVIYVLRGEEGIVFYSCIAAVLCVQQSAKNTIRVARNRVEGTLIGGFIGLLLLLFERSFIPSDMAIVQYLLISFMIIPIIYITVVLKKTSASYISCVVFMSITVSHSADVEPYIFALQRMLDTLIGIFVAWVINRFHLPRKVEKEALYYVDYDALCHKGKMDPYVAIKLRHLMERGAHIGLLSDETPGVYLQNMKHIPVVHPVIMMRGAMLYDIASQTYSQVHVIAHKLYQMIYDDLTLHGWNVFVYSIIHDVLHIYYGELHGDMANTYYQDMRKQPYENYVYGRMPSQQEVVSMMLIGTKDDIMRKKDELLQQPFANQLHIFHKPYLRNKDWEQLFITARVDEVHPIATLVQQYHYRKLRILSAHADSALQKLSITYDIVRENSIIKMLAHYYYHPK